MPPTPSLSPERAAALRLCLASGVGPRLRTQLLERFETSVRILEASLSQLREVSGIGPKVARAIQDAATAPIEPLLQICDEQAVGILLADDAGYPPPLLDIHDPPGVLFQRGAWEPTDALAVAIVGTRHASQYGLQQAERLAGGLARAGFTVVSGLARGIDGAAHAAAMSAGGRTIAVLGSGVLEIYPPEHQKLAEQISQRGAVMSEAHPTAPAIGGMFPQRNRIITGLSLGTVVVEATANSGALISARHAMEQNREVFAVPGRVDSRTSRGCHQLLRDGAKLVESVDDILDELGHLTAPTTTTDGTAVHHPAELQLNEIERAILKVIESQPTAIDQIVVDSQMGVARVLSTLSVLEMRRLIRRVGGNQVMRL